MILSQLVEADEITALSPEELRELIVRLDDEVVNGAGDAPVAPAVATAEPAAEAAAETATDAAAPPAAEAAEARAEQS